MPESGLVSAAFSVPEGPFGERVRPVLAAIDSVHRVGSLPRIPIVERPLARGIDGSYQYDRRRGRAIAIIINQHSSRQELALLHEIGHVLDHQVLGNPGGFASLRHPALEAWRQIVVRSSAYHALREVRWRSLGAGTPPELVDYLLDETELWARSYAQHLAVVSGDLLLAEQIAAAQRRSPPLCWEHWEPGQFNPISAAVAAIFQKKGWQP